MKRVADSSLLTNQSCLANLFSFNKSTFPQLNPFVLVSQPVCLLACFLFPFFNLPFIPLPAACKRKEQEQSKLERNQGPKRTRLVFTDLQRRTLMAIFRENHRPTKDLQVTISQQLGLELSTVSNFFMNARRRNLNKWADEGRPSSTGSSGSSVSSSAVSCSTAWWRTIREVRWGGRWGSKGAHRLV